MEKINLWKQKRSIDLNKISVFLICCFFCAISILGGELDYAGNDDTYRNLISVGAFGSQFDFYIPFSNVLYGIPIAILNRVIPGINWYYWVMLGINLYAIYAFGAIVSEGKTWARTILYTVVINIVLARDYYIALQFTKCGSLWIVVGAVLCFYKIYKENRISIIGILLVTYGVASRFECLLAVLPFVALFGTYAIIRTDKSQLRLRAKHAVITVIAMAMLIMTIVGAEKLFCIVNPEWAEYWTYNRASANLRDYTAISYEHNPSGYDQINTNEDDIALYTRWLFGDTDFYTLEWLEQVADVESVANDNSIRINSQTIFDTFRNIIGTFSDIPIQSMGVIIISFIAAIIVFFESGILPKLFALGNLAGVYVCYFYFTCVGRFMWRAELGVFVATFFMLLLSHSVFDTDESKKSKIIAAIAIFVSVAIAIGYSGYMTYNWRYIKDKRIVAHEVDITGRLYEFNEHEDSFYFLTDFYVTNNPMSITSSKYKGAYKNVAYLGNWIIPSPPSLYYANERGISNPMKALIDNKNTYIWAQDSEAVEFIANHLSRIYGTPVHSELIDQDKDIYRICPD